MTCGRIFFLSLQVFIRSLSEPLAAIPARKNGHILGQNYCYGSKKFSRPIFFDKTQKTTLNFSVRGKDKVLAVIKSVVNAPFLADKFRAGEVGVY